MEIFNNTTKVVKDDLEKKIKQGSKVSIAAACFSIYAYQALKNERYANSDKKLQRAVAVLPYVLKKTILM